MSRNRLNRIIRLAIAGDPVAQEELCRLYIKTITFQVRLLAKSRSDVEDVAQKVLIEMLRSISNLKSPFAFRSWLQQIIVHAVNKQNISTVKLYEKRELLEKADLIADESPDAKPVETAESKELSLQMNGYLDRLPTQQAVSLVLYYYEELSYREIAETLGVSIGSVSSTMSKAKKNLRAMLKADNISTSTSLQLGIVYRPNLGFVEALTGTRPRLKNVVAEEVDGSLATEDVERLITNARLIITASAISAGIVGTTAVSSAGVLGAGTGGLLGVGAAASATAGRLLAGTAFATVGVTVLAASLAGILYYSKQEPTTDVGGNTVTTAPLDSTAVNGSQTPDIYIQYSMQTELNPTEEVDGDYVPINPMSVRMAAKNGEILDSWELSNAAGAELATGTDLDIDITALALDKGIYTITWYMHTTEQVDFSTSWKFIHQA